MAGAAHVDLTFRYFYDRSGPLYNPTSGNPRLPLSFSPLWPVGTFDSC